MFTDDNKTSIPVLIFLHTYITVLRERSGSVVECSTRDLGVFRIFLLY